jgi:1-acyl-sn-glycerol-3-phosphate acyltransferase
MLRGIWTILVFVVATAVLGTGTIVASLARPSGNAIMHLARLWSRLLLAASGARVAYEGLEHVPRDAPAVFAANHQSIVDIWALAPVLPPTTRFVAKASLFRIPLFGWALSAGGFIPIERGVRTEALRSMERAAESIRGGKHVIMFPEGTRSRDGRLLPFKRGAFHLAARAGVPVIPTAISGSGRVVRSRSLRAVPGTVRVAFAPPIHPGGENALTVDDLTASVRRAINARLAPAERGAEDGPREPL